MAALLKIELILELTGWRRPSNKTMSYNIIVPLTKKSDAPSEKFEKASRDLDDIKELLVTNINTAEK